MGICGVVIRSSLDDAKSMEIRNENNSEEENTRKSKSEKRKGFWSFLIGGPVVCGSNRDDVVNSNLLIGGRGRQKEHVLVAGITNFYHIGKQLIYKVIKIEILNIVKLFRNG